MSFRIAASNIQSLQDPVTLQRWRLPALVGVRSYEGNIEIPINPLWCQKYAWSRIQLGGGVVFRINSILTCPLIIGDASCRWAYFCSTYAPMHENNRSAQTNNQLALKQGI